MGHFPSLDAAHQFASGYTGMGNHPVLVSDPTGNVAIDDPSKNIGGDEDGGFPEDYIVAGSDGRQGTTSGNMQDAIGPTGIGGKRAFS